MKYQYDAEHSGFGNEVLYRMCAEQPGHNDLDVVEGKMWLIGRAYAATIERRAGDGFSLRRGLAGNKDALAEIDDWLQGIRGITEVNHENVGKVIAVHKKFVDLISGIIIKGNPNPKAVDPAKVIMKRSFASKYLHFHAPNAFFIYDSLVLRGLKDWLGSLPDVNRIRRMVRDKNNEIAEPIDLEYSSFVFKCIIYRDEVVKKKLGLDSITPRRLDMHLYPVNYGDPSRDSTLS